MNDYVTKPVQIASLRTAFERALASIQAASLKNASTDDVNLEPAIDMVSLDNLRSLSIPGEPDPICDLLHIFREDTASRLAQFKVSLDKKDAVQLSALAHSLKGSAANLGARPMMLICQELEQQTRRGQLDSAPVLIDKIEKEYHRVIKTMETSNQSASPSTGSLSV